MDYIKLWHGLLFAILMLPLSCLAQVVVIDQIPTARSTGSAISDSNCVSAPTLPTSSIAFADDFRITLPSTPGVTGVAIQSVQFQGKYYDAPAASNPTSFLIRIHSDSAGFPGAVISTPALVVTQDLDPASANGVYYYNFTATFTPVALQAGIYWLELVETDNASQGCFNWVTGSEDTTRGRDGLATDPDFTGPMTWSLQQSPLENDNLSIRINGNYIYAEAVNSVPTLSSLAILLLSGLIGLFTIATVRND